MNKCEMKTLSFLDIQYKTFKVKSNMALKNAICDFACGMAMER